MTSKEPKSTTAYRPPIITNNTDVSGNPPKPIKPSNLHIQNPNTKQNSQILQKSVPSPSIKPTKTISRTNSSSFNFTEDSKSKKIKRKLVNTKHEQQKRKKDSAIFSNIIEDKLGKIARNLHTNVNYDKTNSHLLNRFDESSDDDSGKPGTLTEEGVKKVKKGDNGLEKVNKMVKEKKKVGRPSEKEKWDIKAGIKPVDKKEKASRKSSNSGKVVKKGDKKFEKAEPEEESTNDTARLEWRIILKF